MQRLTRWGNSAGLRIGADVMAASGLKIGDYVHVRLLDSGDIRVRPAGELARQRATARDALEAAAIPAQPEVMKW